MVTVPGIGVQKAPCFVTLSADDFSIDQADSRACHTVTQKYVTLGQTLKTHCEFSYSGEKKFYNQKGILIRISFVDFLQVEEPPINDQWLHSHHHK